MRVRIWRSEAETSFAEVEAESIDAAMELIDDGDDKVTWTSTRYNAEYDYEEAPPVDDGFGPDDAVGRALRFSASIDKGGA